MNKWILFFTFTLVSTLMADAFAETIFGPNGLPVAKSPSYSTTNPVMSADEFKNAVSTMGQQAKSDLAAQWKQELAKMPPPSQQQNVSNNLMTLSPSPDTGSMSTTQPVATIPTSAPNASNFPGTNPPKNINAAPAQPQGYTGFGTGQPAAAPATTNSNSKGWNVNY